MTGSRQPDIARLAQLLRAECSGTLRGWVRPSVCPIKCCLSTGRTRQRAACLSRMKVVPGYSWGAIERAMNRRIPLKCFRIVALMVCLVALCGFGAFHNGAVLELDQSTPTTNSANPPDASIEYNDPSGSIPSGRDLRFHQLLKYGSLEIVWTIFHRLAAESPLRQRFTEFSGVGKCGINRRWEDRGGSWTSTACSDLVVGCFVREHLSIKPSPT